MNKSRSPLLVIDASAAVDLVLESPRGNWLTKHLDRSSTWYAPELIQIEAGAVLRRYELNEKLSRNRALNALEDLLCLPIRLFSFVPFLREAWNLRHHMILPDACYVLLARHLNATLVTTDFRLTRASKLGVRTLSPPVTSPIS